MKSITICVLLGYTTALRMDLNQMTEESEEALMNYQEDLDGPIDSMLIQQSDSDSTSSSSSSSDDEDEPMVLSQVRHHRVAELAPDFAGFPVSMHGFIGNNHNGGQWRDAYERKIPGNYEVNEDHEHVDMFTANIMRNYATEGVKDGKPNGLFFITKDQAKSLAAEVVQTHLGYTGD